jgi:hypothetical protein
MFPDLDPDKRPKGLFEKDPRPNIPTKEYSKFDHDLWKATSVLGRMALRATKDRLRFKVRYGPLIPLSMTFVDPEDDKNGYVVVTPQIKKTSPERPHFVVQRAYDKPLFDYFYMYLIEYPNENAGRCGDVANLPAPPPSLSL